MKKYQRFSKLLTIFNIIIILSIFNLTDTLENISFDGKTFTKEYFSVKEKLAFKIEVSPNLKDYVKVEIQGKESEIVNHVVDFTKEMPNGKRVQLSQSLTSSTVMWLTKSQLSKGENYITVQCSKYNCDYLLILSSSDTIEMEVGKQLTYYVSEKDQSMKFGISKSDISTDENEYITIWALGSRSIVSELSDTSGTKVKHSISNIYNFKTSDINTGVFTFEIKKSEIGDLINVGSNLIQNDQSPIKFNEPEIVGLIKQGFNSEICYKMDISGYKFEKDDFLYLTSMFNEAAEVYYKDPKDNIMEETAEKVTTGSFYQRLETQSSNGLSLCVRFPTSDGDKYNKEEISFSIQITNPKYSPSKTFLFSPQKIGKIYPRLTPRNSILSFISMPSFNEGKNLTLNLITSLGFPDMYYDLCKNYPLCEYDDEKLKNITDPHNINSITTYRVPINKERTAISPEQDLLIVKCTDGRSKRESKPMSESEYNMNTCEYFTMFYTNTDSIILKEGLLYSQFILENDVDKFVVQYYGQKTVKKIYVDLMIFTGDVVFNIDSKIEVHKYQNANKIYYAITVDPDKINKEMTFSVKGKKNSYYSILYNLVDKDRESILTNQIPVGTNYLITLDPIAFDESGNPDIGKKIIKFKNIRQFDLHPFFINFYSINCKIRVKAVRMEDDEEFIDNVPRKNYYYTQDILNNDMMAYYSGEYKYIVVVEEMDFSIYNKKFCMAYVSSQELQVEDTLIERQILLADNIPHQIIFEKGYNVIKYLYALSSSEQDLAIRLYLFDKAKYTVEILVSGQSIRKDFVTNSQQIYLNHEAYSEQCGLGRVCPVIVEITCDKSYIDIEPQLEISIKMVGSNFTPTYIIKNKIRNDYLNGEGWHYFYTDIGIQEEGEIIANFYRGSAIMYAKIVQKDQITPIEDPDWRELFKFPKDQNDSFIYIPYLKTINIIPDISVNCTDGCYLLISIKATVQGDFTVNGRQFGFNLLVRTYPESAVYNQIPLISVPVDDYIVGSVHAKLEKYIDTFYSVYFPYDAEKIVIDLQSDTANLYINVGEDSPRPITDFCDFTLNSVGHDTLFEISKNKFLEAAERRGKIGKNMNSLKGHSMIIGVWANKTDSIFSTVYSMKVHLEKKEKTNIYELFSDQKVLCKTAEIDSKNRCLFVVRYEQLDDIFNLLLYPIFHDESIVFEMHANFISKEKYDLYNEDYIKENIPNKDSEFSTTKSNTDFIYLQLFGRVDQYLFVSVITNKPTITELLSTFYTVDQELTPNPSTPQLFLIGLESMKFDFKTEDDLSINIFSINGEADIYWESDPDVVYHLRGRDDRLSLTSSILYKEEDPEKDRKRALSKLIIKNLHPIKNKKEEDFLNPKGFAFYLTYYLRSPMINFDSISMGKSFNFEYRESDLPIAIYSPLENQKKDTNIFISFYNLISDTKSNSGEKIKLYASVIKDSTVYDIKLYPEIKPNYDHAIKGVYDPSIRTGLITLNPDVISKFGINDSEHPTLVIEAEKGENKLFYKRLSLEATVIQDGSLVPVTEKVYQFGKLTLKSTMNIYKLRTDKSRKIMRINLSFNSKYLNWAISKTEGSTKNDTFSNTESKYSNGRLFYTFNPSSEEVEYIYLTIFHSKSKATNEKLTNYAFKYINTNSSSLIKDYIINDPKIECKTSDKNYEIIFNPVPNSENLNIIYLVKMVSKDKLIEEESFQTIAITESPQTVFEYKNPKIDNNKIKVEIKDFDLDIAYLQIIAFVNEGPIHEFVTYNNVFFESSLPKKNGVSGSTLMVFIIIIIILVISVVALIIIVIKCNSKNKDLLEKVNQTSFQQDKDDEPNKNDEGLLFNEGKNSLL